MSPDDQLMSAVLQLTLNACIFLILVMLLWGWVFSRRERKKEALADEANLAYLNRLRAEQEVLNSKMRENTFSASDVHPDVMVMAREAARELQEATITGWPPGMLQDDCSALSKALSRDPNAKQLVREVVAERYQKVFTRDSEGNVQSMHYEALAAWRPIETAPKDDDTAVLLLLADGSMACAYYDILDARWTESAMCYGTYAFPTHWMPLPAALKA